MSATVSVSFMPIRPKTSRICGALSAGSGTPIGPWGFTDPMWKRTKHECKDVVANGGESGASEVC